MFNKFLNDEIINKLHCLHKSLEEANKNISLLEKQNACLTDVLNNLTSLNKKDYKHCIEATSG